MHLLAQHGPRAGDKTARGLNDGLISGVIYSAKDISAQRLQERCRQDAQDHPSAVRLFDPQYYACLLASEPGARLGSLVGEDAHAYFTPRRRQDLERESRVREDLEACLNYQRNLAVTAFVAPNIVIRRSLDSIEATIAKDFLRSASQVHAQLTDPRPLYATLAVGADALHDRIELQNFLQEITELDDPPTGFYLLVEHPDTVIPPTLEEPGVLSRWMLINRVLSLSGYEVINGYSDVLGPYLGAAGASMVATGWFNTLKMFSLNKFGPNSGFARQPVPRYASARLLKSIRHTELEALRDTFPEVLNGHATDQDYDREEGSRPSSAGEALQNWACIRQLSELVVAGNPVESMANISVAVNQAEETYAGIGALGITLRARSNKEHLACIREELQAFGSLAEIQT